MTTTVAEATHINLGRPPSDTDSYPAAAPAWQLWRVITKRRIGFPGEYEAMEREGRAGWKWKGSIRWATREALPGQTSAHLRKSAPQYLHDTGNMELLSRHGPWNVYWISDVWNDVSPATVRRQRHEAAGIPDPAFRTGGGQAKRAAAAVRPKAAVATTPAPGRHQCDWCERTFADNKNKLSHGREDHPAEMAAAADFLCAFGEGDDQCRWPTNEAVSFGKHALGRHHLEDAGERAKLAARSRALARQHRVDAAAPPSPAAGEQPTARAALALTAPALAPSVGHETAPAAAAAPAASVAAPAALNGHSGGVTAADALRSMDVVRAWLRGQANEEANLRAELARERAARQAAELQVARLRDALTPALDLITSG